jgi:hypothetical protein
MYFKLIDIEDSNFNIPAGVTYLWVYNCPLFETVPDSVTDLWVDNCPLYKK